MRIQSWWVVLSLLVGATTLLGCSDDGNEQDIASDAGTDACDDGDTAGGDAETLWVTICGGTFEMGSTEGGADEQPVHTVTVPTFELLQTEVTVAQYARCVDAAGCTAVTNAADYCAERGNWGVAGREDHPLNCLTWVQASEFCEWIGGRLPTEAEWEYAARSGGQDVDYPWGDETATCDFAVMSTTAWGCGTEHTLEVCSIPAGNSSQGLCDMAGNVWEWSQDNAHTNYDGAPSDGSAWVDSSTEFRTLRGGGMDMHAEYLRAQARGGNAETLGHVAVGARCAR